MFEKMLRAAADHAASLGYAPVYVSLHGSQNYALDVYTQTYQSDFDFKCIVLPSLWDLVEGKKPASLTVDTDGGQIDIKDIRIFCDVLERMNPAYLESLATQNYLALEPGMEALRACLPRLMHERGTVFARACEGLFEDKAKRMCHDSPAAHMRIMQYGYDGKQAHHMYRLKLLLEEFERTGEMRLTAPAHERDLLIRLKLNEIALDDVQRMIPGWRAAMRADRMRIEEKSGAPKRDALDEIVRIAQGMMHAHCLKT